MKTILLTDDQGYYPLGTFPTHGATFVRAPIAVVSTDVNGYNGGVFVGAPMEVKQVTTVQGNYTDGGAQVMAPITAVQTDRRGYSIWSGAFVGAPMAVHLN